MQFLSLRELIATYVRDGQILAMEGFTHLIPFAAGHEIIRQGITNLHLVRMTPDLIYDQMIGAGCARALTFSWGGNPGVGSLHRMRDAVENGWPGPLELHEHSHAGMAAAYTAGAARLPFGLLRGYLGTDLDAVNPQIRRVACPFTGQLLAAVGESLECIDAVFLTHEHGDHTAGISGLSRHPHIKIFANHATARAVQAGLKHHPDWQCFETGARFRFRDLEIESFAVPHDAHDPVAFLFTHGSDDLFTPAGRLAWLTDLGHLRR